MQASWETTAILGVMIPIIALILTGIVAVFALHRNYKVKQLEHEQRMAAIEKGIEFSLPQGNQNRPKPIYPFTWPFIFIGFGIALILIYIFDPYSETEALGFGLVILFVGAGLFASRFYGVKKDELVDKEHQVIAENGAKK